MKKFIVFCVAVLMLGILPAVNLIDVRADSQSRGNILYAGGIGPGNYSRIQDAIDNATDGDTVFVFSGTYYECVLVNKSINLIGENRQSTIIDANHAGNVVRIFTDHVMLTGFTIQNSGDFMYNDVGLYIHSDNNTIVNCIISNNIHGVEIEYAHDNLFSENYVHHNWDGILIGGFTSWNQVTNNTISYNDGDGIYVGGDTIFSPTRHETISHNVVMLNNNGISLAGSTETLITRNTITNNRYNGIWLSGDENCVISWNLIRNHGEAGIYLEFASNNTFMYNNIIEVGYWLAYFTNHRIPDKWYRNYWDHSRVFPKVIFGNRMFNWEDLEHAFCLPWVMVDWHPAKEPYDI